MKMNPTVLLSQFETDLLKSKLRAMPEIIKVQKSLIRSLRDNFKDTEQDRFIVESNLVTDIAVEINAATGKAMFSNKEAREAELAKRKAMNEDYKLADKAAREAGYKLEEAQDELEKLQDEYKSYRYIVSLTAQELAVYASCEDSADEHKNEPRYIPMEKGMVAGQPY